MSLKKKRIIDKELIEYIKSQVPCLHCGCLGVDAHHVIPRGRGGDDVISNLMPLCRIAHTEWHSQGMQFMREKYQAIEFWLESVGL